MRVLIILIANLLSLTIWCQLGANYGNPSSNEEGYFIKVDDNFIYTVSATYLNGTEFHTMTKFDKTNYSILWQKRFGVSLRINDGVFIGNDNNPSQMYLVGHTLPENINNNSVLLKIDLTNGSIICSQVYNHYGSERFNKIIRHHNPLNVNFPYYILGVHTVNNNSNAAIGKMFLWNISEDCSNPNFVNFTKEYNHVNDDEFHRGLVALNDKTILLTGNRVEGGYGMVVKVTGNGDVISSRSMSIDMEIEDGMHLSNGNYIFVGEEFIPNNRRAVVFMTDKDFNFITGYRVQNIDKFDDIQSIQDGNIYVLGNNYTQDFGTINYPVVFRIGYTTTAPFGMIISKQNSLDHLAGNTYKSAAIFLKFNILHYIDGRNTGSNFNTHLAQTDANFNFNCQTEYQHSILGMEYNLQNESVTATPYNRPSFTGVSNINANLAIQPWCGHPCNISLQVTKSVDNCSNATFTGIASGGNGPYNYQWDVSCDGVNGVTNPYTIHIGSGTIPFCVTVTDAAGCTAVLSNQTVVGVRDLTKPVIDCPNNVQIANNPGQCFATYAPSISVSDNCDPEPVCTCTMTGSTLGNMPKNTLIQFNVGVTTVTCTATDESGNSASCSFNITVLDGQLPSINCPPHITISCTQDENDLMITGQATASDNCPGVILSHTDSFIGNSCSGTYTRTWKAIDVSGAIVTCVQLIKKEDKTPPTISCPAFITINCDQQPLPALTGTPQVVDNCQQNILPTYTDNIVGTGCDRYIQRIWTANDGCGNIVTCTQNIYFTDQTAPSIICPANMTIACLPADWLTANFGMATGTDNCGSVTISNFDRKFTGNDCHGEIKSWWRTIDACGLQHECVQTIVVNDNIPPVITCPSNISMPCNGDTSPSITGKATATDNCTNNSIIRYTDAYTAQGCSQDLIRTWTATDACGNVDTCVQIITLKDNLKPTITCPPNVTISCEANSSSAFTGEPIVSDFCQTNLIVTYQDVTTGPPCDVTISRTWKVNDGCGNVDSCIQTIKIQDKTPPTFICPPSNVNPIECTGNPSLGVPTNVADNCGGKIDVNKVDVFSTNGCITKVTRTWKVTDQCSNTATCKQEILMQDTKAPIIKNCGRKFTIQGVRNPDGICYGNVTITTPDVTDACSSNVTITNSFNNTSNASSVNYPVGQTIVIWTAKDECGLMTMCMDTVVVECDSDESFCGWAAATCYAKRNSDPVGVLYNVSNTSTAPIGNDWTGVSSIHPSMWTKSQIGDVFGICFDGSNNVYLAATDVYNLHGSLPCISGIAGDAGIYVTNMSLPNSTSIFVKTINSNSLNPVNGNYIPNTGGTGNGIGNIAYDKFNNQFFASNLEDGRIYRISDSGNLLSSYDPYNNDVPSNGICPNGESNWGVAINKDPISNQVKLYFARSKNLTSNPKQIWSIELQPSGEFSGTQLPTGTNIFIDSPSEILEIDNIPGSQNIITDIEFSQTGNMIIAERGSPHNAEVFQYNFAGGWVYLNRLHVGASNTFQNSSAGGVDFGYIDATNSHNCTELVWATGNCMDPQNLANSGCQVYGLEGISPLGNGYNPLNGNTDLFIDFDGNYFTTQKYQIGDVDIYKCKNCRTDSTNCNNLSVSIDSISMPNDSTCCYSLNITNNESTDVTKVCLDLFDSPNWIFNTVNVNLVGYTLSPFTSTKVCVENTTGIPLGITANVINFCLTELDITARDTQCIAVSWYKDQLQTACKDSLKTYCSPPTKKDTCFIFSNIQSECDPENDYAHCVTFTVTNISLNPAYGFVINGLPAGYVFGDCGCGGNIYAGTGWMFNWFSTPLSVGSSRTVCVKILSGLPILDPTSICFEGGIEMLQGCCKSPYPICVELEPCCDPCSDINIMARQINDLDSCCYAIDLNYNCDYNYFSSVSLDILNPDVHFGYYNIGPSDWTLCTPSTSQSICISPTIPAISSGNHPSLVEFCLTDIDDPTDIPQLIHIGFNTLNSQGKDSIACDTILNFKCKDHDHPCTFITNEKIECFPDSNKYRITVTVQNISIPNFTAGFLSILSDPIISPNPIPLVPPLPNDGTTRTVTFCYTPTTFPDIDSKLILVYKLTNLVGDSCCNGNQALLDTLMLPQCDTLPCGYLCKGELFSFPAENIKYGLLNAPASGWYTEYNKPKVIEGGCHSSTQSISLGGITRGYTGDAAGVRINGFTGPVNLFQKGKLYCIKFCAKTLPGLASSSGYLRLRATDGSTLSAGSCTYPSCEIVDNVIILIPNVWEEITIYYSPSQNYTNLVISNHSTDPLDGPNRILIDDLEINSAVPIFNDITPPVIDCPKNISISDSDGDCIIPFTLPAINVTDDNMLSSFNCTLDGSPIFEGSTVSLSNDIVHTVICIAEDICGNLDTCKYYITVNCKPQDTLCQCGGFSKTKFCLLSTGTAVETECNLDNKVYSLPCPGTSLVNFCGTFKCSPDTCSPQTVHFELKNTNTGTLMHATNLTLNIMGKYTINLLPSWCNDPTAIYEIRVKGLCGTDTCVCITKFRVDCPQKNMCKCDDKFHADVAQGFLQSSVVGICKRKFEPRSLCPSDKVEWYLNGGLISTTTGFASATFTVNAGYNDVCMVVIRNESSSVICRDTFCTRTYCKPQIGGACVEIDNSVMVNTIDGYIDDDGTMINWTKDEGWPYAFANEGISDGNIMLIASKDMPSSVRTNRNGAPPKQGFLTFVLDAESYLSTSIPEGTTLELKGISSSGQRVLLSNIDVAGIRKGWYGTIKREISIPEKIYSVVLMLKTTSIEPVFLRIDNFCLYSTVGTNDNQNATNFTIYPNPTTGQLTIQFESTLEQDISLKVFDILGKQVNSGIIQKGNSNYSFTIDHMAGIYIIQLTDSDGKASQRKVIKIE